ncbi:MAG: hypothetical protein GYB35_12250 [Algicola sp.]|nr:hypothetical protein [Algicola sp.]
MKWFINYDFESTAEEVEVSRHQNIDRNGDIIAMSPSSTALLVEYASQSQWTKHLFYENHYLTNAVPLPNAFKLLGSFSRNNSAKEAYYQLVLN